jgi:hypothetical protein
VLLLLVNKDAAAQNIANQQDVESAASAAAAAAAAAPTSYATVGQLAACLPPCTYTSCWQESISAVTFIPSPAAHSTY